MFRLPTARETQEAVSLIGRAMDARRVIELRYLKQLRSKDDKPRYFNEAPDSWVMRTFGPGPMLRAQPSALTGEPVEILYAQGDLLRPRVSVIAYDKPGTHGIDMRTVRPDRVVVGPSGLRLRITPRAFTVYGTGLDPLLYPHAKTSPQGTRGRLMTRTPARPTPQHLSEMWWKARDERRAMIVFVRMPDGRNFAGRVIGRGSMLTVRTATGELIEDVHHVWVYDARLDAPRPSVGD